MAEQIGFAGVMGFQSVRYLHGRNRLEANLPQASGSGASSGFGEGGLPSFIVLGFSTAMAEAMWLPIIGMTIGLVVVLFMKRPSVLDKPKPVDASVEKTPAPQA